MNVSELFFQSALINAAVFLWIASSVTAARILARCTFSLARSLIISALLGPFALIGAYLYELMSAKAKKIPGVSIRFDFRSGLSIFVVTALTIGIFYWFFAKEQQNLAHSSESLLTDVAIAIVIAGFLGGLLLAAIVKRVAFFEACWCSALLSFYILTLSSWADQVFSYGTSAVYFSTFIVTTTLLFLIFLTVGGALGYLLFGEGKFNGKFSYESFLGLRFLMTKRSSQVVSLITVITVIAVMIACSGMIVVMSVMNGFTSDLRSRILGANAHLMLHKYGKDFSNYEEILKKTEKLALVNYASPFVVNEGMISSKNNLSGAIIKGIANLNNNDAQILQYVKKESLAYLENPKSIPVTLERNEDGSLSNYEENSLPGVIIGKEMANDLQVFVGEVVNIISPVGELGPTGPIPKAKPFRVAGLFYSGMYEYDAKFAFMRLKDAQDFFNLKNSISGIEYKLSDVEKTKFVAQEIDEATGGYPYYTRDWMQINRNMFSALQLEKIAMLIILGTLIFMASLLILVTLIMVVMEKGKEIAILKSMGATDASIMKIFVVYGLFVGGIGAFLGGLLGTTLCFFVEKIGIRLDPDIYYFSNLPVLMVPNEIILVIVSAILISFLATIPPSLFAARLKPVEGLRYE